jgi:transposase-like protein
VCESISAIKEQFDVVERRRAGCLSMRTALLLDSIPLICTALFMQSNPLFICSHCLSSLSLLQYQTTKPALPQSRLIDLHRQYYNPFTDLTEITSLAITDFKSSYQSIMTTQAATPASPTPYCKRTSSGLNSSPTGRVPRWVCDRCGEVINKRKPSYDESAMAGYEKFGCSGACDHAEQTMRYFDNNGE